MARIADEAEREADGQAAVAKRLADEASKLAGEAKRLAVARRSPRVTSVRHEVIQHTRLRQLGEPLR